MDRRGFLGAILASACAPAIVRSGILMPVRAIAIPTTEEVAALTGNAFITPAIIAREALRILETRLSVPPAFWDNGLPQNPGRIVVRRPQRFAYG